MNMNLTAVAITGIICLTIAFMAWVGSRKK